MRSWYEEGHQRPPHFSILQVKESWARGGEAGNKSTPNSLTVSFKKSSITIPIGSGEGADPQQAETREHRE